MIVHRPTTPHPDRRQFDIGCRGDHPSHEAGDSRPRIARRSGDAIANDDRTIREDDAGRGLRSSDVDRNDTVEAHDSARFAIQSNRRVTSARTLRIAPATS